MKITSNIVIIQSVQLVDEFMPFIILSKYLKSITKNRFFVLVIFLLLTFIINGFGVWYFEHEKNEMFQSIGDIFWWWIVSSSTVGYGDKYPITAGGRFFGVLTLISAIGALSLAIGAATESVLELLESRKKGRMKVKTKGHIIICGNTKVTPGIINQLTQSPWAKDKSVVLISSSAEENPYPESALFVHGNPSDDEVLQKANITDAELMIVLADSNKEDPDGRTVLTVLSAKRLNPKIRIITELTNEENRIYLTDAGVEAVICASDLVSRLMTHADVYRLIHELVSNDEGIDASTIPMPEKYNEKKFEEAFTEMKQKRNIVIVGVLRNKKMIGNPKMDFKLAKQDRLVVIADDPLTG